MIHLRSVCLLLALCSNATLAQIFVTFSGDTTRIWDANFDFSCAAVFFPIVRVSQDTVFITECDTLPVATCSCTYTICTSIAGLAPGSYTAVITRELRMRMHYPKDTVYVYSTLAGSASFTVANLLAPSLSFYQSPCGGGIGAVSDDLEIRTIAKDVSVYPNPFNPSTVIRFSLAKTSRVLLTIYNVAGQLVSTLVNDVWPQGMYQIPFDAGNQSSGMLICRLTVDGRTISNKMVLIK